MKKSNKLFLVVIGVAILSIFLIILQFFNDRKPINDDETDFTKPIQNDQKPKKNTVNDDADDRTLLTSENISQYNPPSKPNCSEKFNTDMPDTIAKYENMDRGITLELPYNKNWGNETYKIMPYEMWNDETGEEYVLFGPITDFEACSWVRNYALYFYPAKSADMRIEEMKKAPNYSETFIIEPTKKVIAGLDIIEFQSHGLCDNVELEVVGKKYNYVLKPLCGTDLGFLENISKSIKLTD